MITSTIVSVCDVFTSRDLYRVYKKEFCTAPGAVFTSRDLYCVYKKEFCTAPDALLILCMTLSLTLSQRGVLLCLTHYCTHRQADCLYIPFT